MVIEVANLRFYSVTDCSEGLSADKDKIQKFMKGDVHGNVYPGSIWTREEIFLTWPEGKEYDLSFGVNKFLNDGMKKEMNLFDRAEIKTPNTARVKENMSKVPILVNLSALASTGTWNVLVEQDECNPDGQAYFEKRLIEITGKNLHDFKTSTPFGNFTEADDWAQWEYGDYKIYESCGVYRTLYQYTSEHARWKLKFHQKLDKLDQIAFDDAVQKATGMSTKGFKRNCTEDRKIILLGEAFPTILPPIGSFKHNGDENQWEFEIWRITENSNGYLFEEFS